MEMKLDGEPLELHPTPPSILKLIACLEKLPDNEVFSNPNVCRLSGIAPQSLAFHARDPALAAYREKGYRNMNLWGNPRAIAELRRRKALP